MHGLIAPFQLVRRPSVLNYTISALLVPGPINTNHGNPIVLTICWSFQIIITVLHETAFTSIILFRQLSIIAPSSI
ncbi:hypothetical protein ACKLNR_009913 [Fusarium oxysporum f. sp. zingiberi]